jgi:pyruvate kinase
VAKFIITNQKMVGNKFKVSTTYEQIVHDVKAGDTILIDDGNIELITERVEDNEVHTKVIHGGMLMSRKGINLPNTKVSAPSLTEKDRKDLKFGLEQEVDWIALSFVRTAKDILELKKIIESSGKHSRVVAKIEKPEALENIDDIIEVTDALMVARGDLGVEIAMEDVPLEQKKLVRKCNIAGKPVIIATQMMESMIQNPRPTRAETNDVANAVMDGADALMLSAESASGSYPVHAVRRMALTIANVENNAESIYNKYHDKEEDSSTRLNDLLVRAASRLSRSVKAKALVGLTKSGYTAYRLTMHRPKADIYVFTDKKYLLYQLNLLWGVKCFFYDNKEVIDDTLKQLENILKEGGHIQKGDVLIHTSSMPSHWEGHTNMMKVSEVD